MQKVKAILILAVVCIIVGVGAKWVIDKGWTSTTLQSEQPNLSAQGSNNEEQNVVGGEGGSDEEEPGAPSEQPSPSPSDKPAGQASVSPPETPQPSDNQAKPTSSSKDPVSQLGEAIPVVAEPESITALINPNNRLPDDYVPSDLVYPDVRFVFKEKIDKRKMRKEAAEALEKMFAAADEDGAYLAGVSAYRSHEYQIQLFNRYVKEDGLEKARTYSAYPGTSEHESGLAIDVTRSDGKCAASDCFGEMKEAAWLADHAHKYGFIIRYPEGKDKITGYKYEPWHLRYVGTELAEALAASGETLEEYYDAVPVNR
ncbi:M15 family metallopeptidase [Paenibacillus sp. IITD108]|uniref:M15 family metallopeptidase n=1 Tax=Paenibacillus sp. IITD108 TaxID=3116649 RepID=UPI002F3F8ADA